MAGDDCQAATQPSTTHVSSRTSRSEPGRTWLQTAHCNGTGRQDRKGGRCQAACHNTQRLSKFRRQSARHYNWVGVKAATNEPHRHTTGTRTKTTRLCFTTTRFVRL